MSRCELADAETGGAYVCRREVGHDGPCAAELRHLVVDEPQCDATHAWASVTWKSAIANVACTLPRGHDLDHQGSIGWPS